MFAQCSWDILESSNETILGHNIPGFPAVLQLNYDFMLFTASSLMMGVCLLEVPTVV